MDVVVETQVDLPEFNDLYPGQQIIRYEARRDCVVVYKKREDGLFDVKERR